MAVWIFLRGLNREASHWGSFTAEFEQAIADAKVIALDLPGNGALRHVSSPLSISQIVTHCRSELGRLGTKPPYHVLAISMGAMVASQWATETPAEIAAAVLINTSFRPFSPFYARLRPINYGHLLGMALPGASPQSLEQAVLQLTSNHPERHEAAVAEWISIHKQRPVRKSNALRQLLAAARFKASRERPATPVLLLGSCQDRLVNIECTLAIARHWNCPVALHPDSGHDLPLDDAVWVIQQVQNWLTEGPVFTPAISA
jgi:pimeloyl-ACP methyl ester carboxylesterase